MSSENLIQTKLNSYTESASESITLKNAVKATIRKPNGTLAIMSLFHKMIYTQLHGKRNLVDTYLTFLSYKLILRQLTLMKVTHRDQILFLSHVPIFTIRAMVKTAKHAPFLTHLYHNLQSLNRMVEAGTLRPLQSYLKMIIPSKFSSQAPTLKLHETLLHNHH